LRVIFGIGNPGIRYEHTRHNAGFLLLDFFAQKRAVKFHKTTGEYLEAAGCIGDNDFVIIKPVGFVNNSGIAAKQIFELYKIIPEDFLVVCDDINLANLTLRVRLSGGDGGHNGLSSIIYNLSTDQFPRIRIGIGSNPEGTALSDYVLSKFADDELKDYMVNFKNYCRLIEEFIIGGSKKMLEAYSILVSTKKPNGSAEN
jgi:PTH1 family peptidyl-tRNA hydrolase